MRIMLIPTMALALLGAAIADEPAGRRAGTPDPPTEWEAYLRELHQAKGGYDAHEWAWRTWHLYDPSVPWVSVEGFTVPNRDGEWLVTTIDAFGHSETHFIGNVGAEAAVAQARRRFLDAGHDRHLPVSVYELKEAPTGHQP